MFHCPHCGEPIDDDDAQSCPHCGSDAETGWNPDADYYSVELPEDDLEPARPRRRPALPRVSWEQSVGTLLVLVSAAVFVWAAWKAHGKAASPFLLVTGVCFGVFLLLGQLRR